MYAGGRQWGRRMPVPAQKVRLSLTGVLEDAWLCGMFHRAFAVPLACPANTHHFLPVVDVAQPSLMSLTEKWILVKGLLQQEMGKVRLHTKK